MFSGDWRPSDWPAVEAHSSVQKDGGRGAAAWSGRCSGPMQVAGLGCWDVWEGKWASGGGWDDSFQQGCFLAAAQLAAPQRLIRSCSRCWCLVASLKPTDKHQRNKANPRLLLHWQEHYSVRVCMRGFVLCTENNRLCMNELQLFQFWKARTFCQTCPPIGINEVLRLAESVTSLK